MRTAQLTCRAIGQSASASEAELRLQLHAQWRGHGGQAAHLAAAAQGAAAAGATAHASGSAEQRNSSLDGRVASSIFIQNSARVSEAPAGRAKMQAV